MGQMRIVQVVQKPQRRGAEVFSHQLTQYLRAAGHDASILYLYPHTGLTLPLSPNDELLGGDEASPLERFLHPGLMAKLQRAVSRRRPHIVQVNGARAVKYGAALRSLHPGWSLVYRNIDSPRFWVHGVLKKAAYRSLFMSRMDGVVGVSAQTLAEVRSFYQLDVPHVLIENGADFRSLDDGHAREAIRAQRGAAGAVVVAFVGALAPQKRPDRFLRMMKRLREEGLNVQAWMLGDGPLRGGVASQVSALGLTEHVQLLGAIDRVGPLLDAADLVVSTSDTEGIPAALIEASHMGRAVVAPRVGGVAECIVHEQTGLLFAPADELGLVDAVRALVRDGARRAELGANGKRFVDARFSMDVVGPRYEAFYEQMLRQG